MAQNPSSKLTTERHGKDARVVIERPWGDESVVLLIPTDSAALTESLTHLYLPERLTAIYHKDSKKLEVIWTAGEFPEIWEALKKRTFSFDYAGNSHACYMAKSSERLLAIATVSLLRGSSASSYRNLQTYWLYCHLKEDQKKLFGIQEPVSFWIDDIEWSDTGTIALVQHLNFYMTYYDRRGPFIVVHPPKAEESIAERARHLHGDFPKRIKSALLETSLLSFWDGAYTSNPLLAYLLYYRVLEYAASGYIDYEVRAKIGRLLAAPNIHDSDRSGLIDKIVDTVHEKNADEIPRLKRLVRNNVQPELLWKDIEANREIFSADVTFDGGFIQKGLISKTDTKATFCGRSLDFFTDQIRILRNTLAHGKQIENAGVIDATARNINLIRPWTHLVATAAGEVILYKDV